MKELTVMLAEAAIDNNYTYDALSEQVERLVSFGWSYRNAVDYICWMAYEKLL